VPRVTLYHCTLPKRLPLIEEDGLRTRADLSGIYGPPGALDAAAPGTYAHGKRVSGWWSEAHARDQVADLGAGFVSDTFDPAKTLAAPASLRDGDPDAYWAATRPLRDWLAGGEPPVDLEVHQNLPVRAKHLRLHAPLLRDEQLGAYAPLVAAVADDDRLSAKAIMHLAIIASDGDFDGQDFAAACALAWRDEPDPPSLVRELMDVDPDKVASAALAEHGGELPELAARLREILEETREWSEQNGMDHGRGLLSRASTVLDELPDHVA
jgi:hypothetical protein